MNIKTELNQRIDKNGMHGYIKYIGPLEGKEGTWVGILLDNEDGKNYGSYNDVQYFECYGKKRGVFVIADKLFVNPEKDYKEKYEKLMIHSKAKQNILENRSDTKVMKYKALVKKRDKEIEELNKKIGECGCRNGKIGKAQLKEKIEELSKKVENMAKQVNSAKEDLLHIQNKPKTVSKIKKNQYRNYLIKLLEAVNDDELFVAQYKKFMSM